MQPCVSRCGAPSFFSLFCARSLSLPLLLSPSPFLSCSLCARALASSALVHLQGTHIHNVWRFLQGSCALLFCCSFFVICGCPVGENERRKREREIRSGAYDFDSVVCWWLCVCVCVFVCEQGTSADQDTRFSNKMKKLLKSQKFAPELDVLVRFLCPWWFHMFPCHLVLFAGSVSLFLLLFPVFLRAILAVVWQPSSWKFCGSGRGIYPQIMLVSQQILFSLMLLLSLFLLPFSKDDERGRGSVRKDFIHTVFLFCRWIWQR